MVPRQKAGDRAAEGAAETQSCAGSHVGPQVLLQAKTQSHAGCCCRVLLPKVPQGAAGCCCRPRLSALQGAAAGCYCRVLLQGATAGCCCRAAAGCCRVQGAGRDSESCARLVRIIIWSFVSHCNNVGQPNIF